MRIQMVIVFTLRLRRDKGMTTDLFLKMVASYFMIIGGVYLLITMIEILKDYLREKKLLDTLDTVGEEIDWDKEDEWYWSIK
jgi:hypothetical protein